MYYVAGATEDTEDEAGSLAYAHVIGGFSLSLSPSLSLSRRRTSPTSVSTRKTKYLKI